MALNINTEEFRNTAKELDDLANQGTLNKDSAQKIITNKGFNTEEFIEGYKKLNEMSPEERDKASELTGIGIIDVPARLVGRALGETGRSIADISQAFAPKFSKEVAEIGNKIGAIVPEEVKDFADEIFDPYHGSGVYGEGEEMVGNVLSYFVPATGILKATKGVSSLAKNSNTIRSALTRTKRTLGRKGRKGARIAGYGGVGAASATIIEDPAENTINILREQFPESTQYLDRFAINPEDSEAKQYLQSFINNLGLETVLFGGLAGLAKTWNKTKNIRRKYITQPLKLDKFLTGFSSRRGMSDDHLAKFIKRDAAAKNSLESAIEDSKQLEKAMKSSKFTSKENVDLVNDALQGNSIALDALPENVKGIVNSMRDKIDNLSGFFLENNRTSGSLSATIDENLGAYITRSYEMFDNPEYYDKIQKAIKKNRPNIEAGQLVSITDEAVKNMSDYLINDLKLQPRKAAQALDELMADYAEKTGRGEQFDIGEFLFSLGNSAKKASGTTKAFQKREILPNKIKAFLGEVKDPGINYVNAYQKLAVYKAETEFLEELADDLIKSGAAKRVNAKTGELPDSLDRTTMARAGDVVAERLGKVFGRGVVSSGKIKNPFDSLYVDKNYVDTLKQGLDAIDPSKSKIFDAYVRLKVATQMGKTVYNPGTHAINVLGNGMFMISNGFVPGASGLKDAGEFVISKFTGLKNEDLTKRFNKYRELGITGTDLALETIRTNLDRISSRPEKYFKKTFKPLDVIKKPIGFIHNKIKDAYQLEDDVFKIMHFENTKDYLRKAYTNISEENLDKMAAERTRDLLPNYKIAPKNIKKLRTMPFGDFATFATESARVAKNLIKYTVQDALSGNEALTKMAARRLAGMTVAGLGAEALHNKSKMMFGISDDQEEALNTIAEPWEYGVPQIYLSGVEKQGGKNVVKSVSTGRLDPFIFPKMTAKFLHRIFNDPKFTPERLANIKNDPELAKFAISMYDQTLSPFIGTSIATDALLDAVAGVRGKGDVDYAEAALKFLEGTISPSLVQFLKNRKKYEIEAQRKEPGLRDKGYPSNALFSERTKGVPGEADWAALTGFKTRLVDIDSTIPYNLQYKLSDLERNNEVSDLIKKKTKRKFNLKKYLTEGNLQINKQDIIDAKIRDEKRKIRKEREIRMYLKKYKDLGLSINDIIRIMKIKPGTKVGDRLLRDIILIDRNQHMPILESGSRTDVENYIRILQEEGVENPFPDLMEINNKIINKEIE